MRILAVDDEAIMLERLVECIQEVIPHGEIHSFRRPSEALECARTLEPDIAFLDVQMRGMDGITLGRELRALYPRLNVIYITAYMEHAFDAYQLNASGYLLKPVDPEEMRQQVRCLRYPIEDTRRVKIRCFGNFDVEIDGKRVRFRYEKTKELLAYLVDRCGAACGMEEIMAALWEDDRHASYLQNLRKDLQDTLRNSDLEEVIERKRGQIALNPELVACDYYEWKRGNREGENAYRGEYMTQYSWAEETHGLLENLQHRTDR